MHRRDALATIGGIGAATIAGCSNVQSFTSDPDVRFEYRYRGYIRSELQPAIVVTGTIRNQGTGSPTFELECELVRADESLISRQATTIEDLSPSEKQLFHFIFDITGQEAEGFNDVRVSTEGLPEA